jgi:hypothetical protein
MTRTERLSMALGMGKRDFILAIPDLLFNVVNIHLGTSVYGNSVTRYYG